MAYGSTTLRLFRFLALTALVTVSLAAGIEAALRLTQAKLRSAAALHTAAAVLIDSKTVYPFQRAGRTISSFPTNSSQANILELPKASIDFIGYWGGYIHSSIQRLSPDLVGTTPDRVSVVFGRHGDTVFIASELYSPQDQKIVHGPRIRVVSARVAVVEYESADNDLYYICSHRFQLNNTASISYLSTVDVYDLKGHRLMGVVTQRATLKRLLTPRDQRRFARPGRNQSPRAEIAATTGFARH